MAPNRFPEFGRPPDSFRYLACTQLWDGFFTESETAPGAMPVAILSHGYWQRRFSGDKYIAGGKRSGSSNARRQSLV